MPGESVSTDWGPDSVAGGDFVCRAFGHLAVDGPDHREVREGSQAESRGGGWVWAWQLCFLVFLAKMS